MNAPLPLKRARARPSPRPTNSRARVSNEVAGTLAARLAAETRGEVLFALPTVAAMPPMPRSTR